MNSDQFTATVPKFHCDLRLGTLDIDIDIDLDLDLNLNLNLNLDIDIDFRHRTTTLDVGARRSEGGDASERRNVAKQSRPESMRDCARCLPIRIFATVKGVNTTANQPVRADGLGRNLVDSAFFRRPWACGDVLQRDI